MHLILVEDVVSGSAGISTCSFSFWRKSSTAVTELWNGTNWTEVNDLNTARFQSLAGAGTQYSSFSFWWNSHQVL